jgi:hypothetical protein
MRKFEALTPDRSELPAGHTPDLGPDYGSIEQLFDHAMAMGLPHGDYGLACAIYASGVRKRYPEALAHAEKAAHADVFEAQVLLVSYYLWGVGTTGSNDAAERARERAFAALTALKWPMQSGAPGTVSIPSRFEAETLAATILGNGKCGPRTARLTPMAEIDAAVKRARATQLPREVNLPIRRYTPNQSDSPRSDLNDSSSALDRK